ncbi:galactoside alpha-(1,2)-fucosyltransferase 2-like [Palaemon carinicauda]|uniref:galactoside alpha-(1,2)-fucosyltransferase 2-like n=1 Tax=Palaemon carinicauda TaxID=392227 RepID=UPI0035B5A5FD
MAAMLMTSSRRHPPLNFMKKPCWKVGILSILSVMLVMLYISSKNLTLVQHPIMVKMVERMSKIQESLGIQSNYSALEPSYPVPFERRYNESGCYKRKPVVAIAPWQRVQYGGRWNGLKLPVLVMAGGGNLGNIMSNYASIYAIGRAYNVTVRINKGMHQQLMSIFPNMTINALLNSTKGIQKLAFLRHYVYGNVEAAAAGLLGPHIFSVHGCPVEVQLFHAYSCEIRKEFTFSPDFQEKVKEFWLAKRDFVGDAVRVGFHIRRGDYIRYARKRGRKLPNETYYENAMNFYKERFNNVVFVIASNDREYINKTFENHTDVIFVPGTNREEDMAILASCDHSIMTVGTFSFWTAYLAGGYVVYPGDFYIPNYPVQKERFERAHMDYFVPISQKPL